MITRLIHCPACGLDLGVAHDPLAVIPEEIICPACGHGKMFRVETRDDVIIVYLQGRGIVTEQNVMRVLERIRTMVTDRACPNILLNFDGVHYLSSTILARLINLARLAEDKQTQFKLCSLKPDVQDILRITRIESCFELYDSQDKALEAFRRGAASTSVTA